MSVYTSDSLIAGIKRRGMIPSSQQTFQEADFLALLNDELNALVKVLVATREDHFQYEHSQAITSGKASYRIPANAIGGKVSRVVVVDGGQERDLNLIPQEDVSGYANQTGIPNAFHFQRSSVVLLPTPSASATLKIIYPRRPNRIVSVNDAPAITAINTGTNTVTVAAAPSTFVTGARFDLIQGNPGFDVLGDGLVGTVTGNDITFSSLPDDLAVGDIIALQGESSVAQIVPDLLPLLQHRALERVAEAMSLTETVEMARRLIEEETAANTDLLSPRADATPKVFVAEEW